MNACLTKLHLQPKLYLLFLSLAAWGAPGCGKDGKTPRSPGSGGASGGTAPAPNSDTNLGAKPFAWGAYLASDLASTGDEAGFEFGSIYMRKQHFVGDGDTFDYTWVQATAFGSTGFLPQKASTGCAEATPTAPAAETATGVVLSGAVNGALAADGTLFQLQDVTSATKVDHNSIVKASLAMPGGAVTLESPKVPSDQSYLRLSGAYDFNLTTNLPLSDLTTNLRDATNDLKISFSKKSDSENLAIVTFFGGAAATSKVYRCFIPAGGSVVIPPAAYKKLIPVRGLLGVLANVQTKVTGSATTWTSSIYGSGMIDQSVP